MKPTKLYFPALDGLRFFAFFFVFLHHVTFYLREDISKNIFWKFFQDNGWVGVDMFFVLTGFLVTLLLLEERKVNGQFSFKDFILRRILRIWPLYFLALSVGLAIAMVNGLKINFPWHLVFLGNWGIVLNGYGDSRHVSQLWAISVDQQFYILWPLLLLFLKNFKNSLFVAIIIILSSILLRMFLVNSRIQHPAIYVNTFARLDTFMFGSILGLVLFYKPNFLKKIKNLFSPIFQILSITGLVIFLYFVSLENRLAIRNGVFGYLVISITSTFIILSLIKGDSFLTRALSKKPLRYLGKISYGLYIWHILALEILFYLITDIEFNLLIPLLGFPLVILFGYLSYEYFEKPFLKLKSKI